MVDTQFGDVFADYLCGVNIFLSQLCNEAWKILLQNFANVLITSDDFINLLLTLPVLPVASLICRAFILIK